MLDRIRGKPKVDPALEELRRKTAARLAAIVGLTEEAELDTELDPREPVAADAPLAASEVRGEPETHDTPGSEGLVLALAAPTGAPDDSAAEAVPEGTEADFVADLGAVEAAHPAPDLVAVSDRPSEDEPLEVDAALPLHSAAAAVVAPVSRPVALPANAVAVMAVSTAATPAVKRPAARSTAPDRAAAPSKAAKAVAPKTSPASSSASPAAPVPVAPAKAAKAPAARATTKPSAASPVSSPVPEAKPAKPAAPVAKAPSPGAKRGSGVGASPRRGRKEKLGTDLPAACPTCGRLLEEIPTTSRRCVGCGQRIVPKRLDGRRFLLAEAVVPLFEAERKRLVDGGRLARECGQWLRLAALVGAPPDVLEARARAVAARPTREAVAAARALYAKTVERTCRAARRAKDWNTVADLRLRQARAYHRAAGAPIPPEPEVVALHRDAIEASLRGIAEVSREAQLTGGACCEACSARSGQTVRIAAERKAPSLPHEDCPVGLCGCRWQVPDRRRAAVSKLTRRRAQPAAPTPRKARSNAG